MNHQHGSQSPPPLPALHNLSISPYPPSAGNGQDYRYNGVFGPPTGAMPASGWGSPGKRGSRSGLPAVSTRGRASSPVLTDSCRAGMITRRREIPPTRHTSTAETLLLPLPSPHHHPPRPAPPPRRPSRTPRTPNPCLNNTPSTHPLHPWPSLRLHLLQPKWHRCQSSLLKWATSHPLARRRPYLLPTPQSVCQRTARKVCKCPRVVMAYGALETGTDSPCQRTTSSPPL